MANLNGHVKITVQDGIGFTAASEIYFAIPEGATLTQAHTELGNLVAAFNDVTAGKIVDAEFRLKLALPSANDPSGTELNNAVGLRYPVPSTGRHWSLVIPAAAAATLSGGLPVMTEDGTLDTFADILEVAMATTGTTTGFYANNAFQALGPSADGFRPARKLEKRIRSRTLRIGG